MNAGSVAGGSIYLTLQNIPFTLIGVLGYAYLSRAVTQEEMGVIAGVTLLYSLVQTAVELGINSSIAKFVSEDIGKSVDHSMHVVSALTLRLPPNPSRSVIHRHILAKHFRSCLQNCNLLQHT